jgi:hypothetical protein
LSTTVWPHCLANSINTCLNHLIAITFILTWPWHRISHNTLIINTFTTRIRKTIGIIVTIGTTLCIVWWKWTLLLLFVSEQFGQWYFPQFLMFIIYNDNKQCFVGNTKTCYTTLRYRCIKHPNWLIWWC